MNYVCSVFDGNDYLGEAIRDDIVEGLRVVRQSTHYFCDVCGEVWARIIADPPAQHRVLYRYCTKCWQGEDYKQPIFFEESRYAMQTRLPQAAMRRDLIILMAAHGILHEQETT